jgi:7,8-dihydropterin-6-yl-methyl-4-(beta-D-ribofuranosyl)aminobenzene 5'-phosphate synthase
MDPSLLASFRDRVRLVVGRTSVLDAVEVLPAAPLLGPGPVDNARLMRNTDAGDVPDQLDDELSLLVHGPDGGVLVTGCSHRGIVNIVRQAAPVRVVAGGLHLAHESDERVGAVAHELAELGVEELWVGHCTGDRSVEVLSREFAGQVVRIPAGTRHGLPSRAKS